MMKTCKIVKHIKAVKCKFIQYLKNVKCKKPKVFNIPVKPTAEHNIINASACSAFLVSSSSKSRSCCEGVHCD